MSLTKKQWSAYIPWIELATRTPDYRSLESTAVLLLQQMDAIRRVARGEFLGQRMVITAMGDRPGAGTFTHNIATEMFRERYVLPSLARVSWGRHSSRRFFLDP